MSYRLRQRAATPECELNPCFCYGNVKPMQILSESYPLMAKAQMTDFIVLPVSNMGQIKNQGLLPKTIRAHTFGLQNIRVH